MAKGVIEYAKALPEVRGRRPWEKPTSFLVKDEGTPTGWREDTSGRRPSNLLLIPKIRAAVDTWREQGYPGGSAVTHRLFNYWFEEDHDVAGFDAPLRFYFCQREAIETLAWLVEVAKHRDAKDIIASYGTAARKDLFSDGVRFQTTMDGKRQIRRYVAELNAEGLQDLPRANLRRFAFKLATGAGKTWLMAMAIVWCRFHKQHVPGSEMSTNFLVVAPNIIVYQRLAKDFASNRIFYQLPLIPPEWRNNFHQKVILRGESTEPDPSCNLFLTNIHQLYESRDHDWTPANAVEALLGSTPSKASGVDDASILARVKSLRDVVVLNDEAHHVHDDKLAWHKSLTGIDEQLPSGINAWLDFSATPKDQNGMYFPWTVVDYPLAQAVEDRIVKAPLIVAKEVDEVIPDPDRVTKKTAVEQYGHWLDAAVARWKVHYATYKLLGIRPVLFIMAEVNAHADALGEYLWKSGHFGFQESEILVIHTDSTGEVRRGDLEKAREAARNIDKDDSPVKVILSVMMLREGWDVRNVTIVVGLRPFTARAQILPEQVIGRGLRLMKNVSPDRTQTLEVLGTNNLLKLVRDQLEAEGVGVGNTKSDPVMPIIISPVRERLQYDISIPLTKPRLAHKIRKLSDFDVCGLEPIFEREELAESFRIRLRLNFATTETEVHQEEIAGATAPGRDLIAGITKAVIRTVGLSGRFAELYPMVRDYVTLRCFGRTIVLDDQIVRSHLSRVEIREGISRYLAKEIGQLTVEHRELEFERQSFHLSETKPFSWRRNLSPYPLEERKTVFNYVATYNDYEREFAQFLGRALDVVRFAALGTTEQGGSGTAFRVDYLKPTGAIGFYYPDWVAVQQYGERERNWIIETKGRVWEGTEEKDAAMEEWCRQVNEKTNESWRYLRVNQKEFRSGANSLSRLVEVLGQ